MTSPDIINTQTLSAPQPFAEQAISPQTEMSGLAPDSRQSIFESARLAVDQTVEYAGDKFVIGYRKLLAGATALALATTGAGLFEPQATDAAASTLHSPQYLQRHCPIAVTVNVFTAGGSIDKKSGVSVQGKEIDSDTAGNPSPDDIVKYTWQISKADQFCGIVGVWGGPHYKSLNPTSETSRGGEYTDTSLSSANGLHLNEFF